MKLETSQQDIKKRITRAVSYVSFATIGIILLRACFIPLLVRMVSVNEFGNYSVVLSIVTLTIAFANLGTATAIQKYVAEKLGNICGELKEVVGSSLTVSGLIILVVLPLLFVLVYLNIFNFSAGISELLVYGVWIIVLSILFENLRSILLGLHLQHISETIRLLLYVIYFGLGATLLFLDFGIKGVFLSYIISLITIVGCSFKIIISKTDLNSKQNFKSTVRFVKPILRFGIWVMCGIVLAEILYQADILMIRYFRSSEETGLYKAALITTQFIWIFPRILQDSLLPALSELWSKQKKHEIAILLSRGIKYIYLSVLLLGGALFIFGKPFILFYFGTEYIEAVFPIKILVIGTACFAISRIYNPLLQASENLKANLICSGIATLINLILNFFLIRVYGISGAAIATSLSYASLLISKSIVVKARLKLDLLVDILVSRGLVLSISYVGILTIIKKFATSLHKIELLVAIIISVLLFFVLARVSNVIDKNDMRLLIDIPFLGKIIKFVGK